MIIEMYFIFLQGDSSFLLHGNEQMLITVVEVNRVK